MCEFEARRRKDGAQSQDIWQAHRTLGEENRRSWAYLSLIMVLHIAQIFRYDISMGMFAFQD